MAALPGPFDYKPLCDHRACLNAQRKVKVAVNESSKSAYLSSHGCDEPASIWRSVPMVSDVADHVEDPCCGKHSNTGHTNPCFLVKHIIVVLDCLCCACCGCCVCCVFSVCCVCCVHVVWVVCVEHDRSLEYKHLMVTTRHSKQFGLSSCGLPLGHAKPRHPLPESCFRYTCCILPCLLVVCWTPACGAHISHVVCDNRGTWWWQGAFAPCVLLVVEVVAWAYIQDNELHVSLWSKHN